MANIGKTLRTIATKNPVLWKSFKYALHTKRRVSYAYKNLRTETDDKTVIFNTFNGKSYGCTPKAIYEYMLSQKEYSDWKFVWAFVEPSNYKYLEQNFNTTVVKQNSKAHMDAMAKAKYWVTNYRVRDYVWPKADQVYIQCWHGTPLKRLGYDLETSENAIDSIKDIRKKYDMDAKKFKYILSPSRFASEKFISAWNLKEQQMEDKVMEIGYPRNDFLSNYKQSDIDKIKEKLGIPKEKKVILYAPTWRDNQHQGGVGFTYDLNVDFGKLREALGEEYVMLFRVHYLVASEFSFDEFEGFIYNVSEYDDINHLYAIADLLITDYSSVFFDYGILKKPMLFYMYDLEDYKDSIRGFYFDVEQLPGQIVTQEKDLPEAIKNSIHHFVYDDKYRRFNEMFNALEDGKASQRFVEKVMLNKKVQENK